MKGFLKALFLIPLALVVVLLAVANRAPVRISLDPFAPSEPLYAVSAPLWVILFAAVTLGVLVGGTAAWLVQGKHRRLERQYRREARDLRDEVTRAKEREGAASAAALPAPAASGY